MAPATSAGAEARSYVVVYDTPPRAPFPVQAETAARERALGFRSTRRYRHALDGFAARLTAADVRALRADPEVAYVSPNRTVHAARVPLSPTETVPTGVQRIGAGSQAAGVHPPSGAAVAVLDTGIDLSHPDLVAYPGPNCVQPDLAPEDDNGHGTSVAGVIGATNEGSGVVGVAPGTELYAVKVLGSNGSGYLDQVICGIDWVTAFAGSLGIRVVNMSLSEQLQWEPLHLAVRRSVGSGLVYTVAAGNAPQTGPPRDIALQVPGAYPEVLTVTAMSDTDGAPGGTGPASCSSGEGDDRLATFSNYATRPEEMAHVVAAPGVCIESTALGGGLEVFNGTSAAAPHAAGVVAVCMGEPGRPGPCADMSPAEVIEQVRADAAANATSQNGFLGDPFSPVMGRFYGHLLSGVDPTIRRIPPRPTPAVAAVQQQVPADTTLDVLELRIARRQDVDRLSVVARLAEAGTVRARARLRVAGGAARLILSRRAVAQAAPNQTLRLRLRLRSAGLRRVKRALRRGVRVRARVTVTVSDLAGNARTKARRVRLRP